MLITENGSSKDIASYKDIGIPSITAQPVTTETTTTPSHQIFTSGLVTDMGTLKMTIEGGEIPKVQISGIPISKSLHELSYDMMITHGIFYDDDGTVITDREVLRREVLTDTQRYMRAYIQNNEENLAQLAEVLGEESVSDLKAMSYDDLGALYSKNIDKLTLNVGPLPGSRAWREVFGDPTMSDEKRTVIADLVDERTVAYDKGDTQEVLDITESLHNIIPDDALRNNERVRAMRIIQMAGGWSGYSEMTEEESKEFIRLGVQNGFDLFAGSPQQTARISQEIANKGAMLRLLQQQEVTRANLAAISAGQYDRYKEWTAIDRGINMEWNQMMDQMDAKNYQSEQELAASDVLKGAWQNDIDLLDSIAEEDNKDWGDPDNFEELSRTNDKFRGAVERLNENWLLRNAPLDIGETRKIYESFLNPDGTPGMTPEEIDAEMTRMHDNGAFDIPIPPTVVDLKSWDQAEKATGVYDVHPSETVRPPQVLLGNTPTDPQGKPLTIEKPPDYSLFRWNLLSTQQKIEIVNQYAATGIVGETITDVMRD